MLYGSGQDNTESEIIIADDVIASIVYSTVNEIEGVSAVASKTVDGKIKISSSKTTAGIKLEVSNNEVTVTVSLIIKSWASVPETALKVQKAVKNAVQSITGKTVVKVDVVILDADFDAV